MVFELWKYGFRNHRSDRVTDRPSKSNQWSLQNIYTCTDFSYHHSYSYELFAASQGKCTSCSQQYVTIHTQTLTMNFCKICRYQHWVRLPKQTAILKFWQHVPTHKQHYQGVAAQTRALFVQTAPTASPWSSLAGFPWDRSLGSEASWHLYSSFLISWT